MNVTDCTCDVVSDMQTRKRHVERDRQ